MNLYLLPLPSGKRSSCRLVKYYSYTNQAVEYVYNGAGDVSEYIDYIANKRYVYSYDVAGRVESVCCYYLNGNAIVLTDKISATYDSESRLSAMNYAFKFGGSNYSYSGTYTYDVLGRVTAYNENSFISTYTYLPIGFVGSQKTTYGSATVETVYGYEESPRSSVGLYELTGRVANATVTVKYGSTQKSQNDYTFTYDAAGNITAIRVGGALKYSYEYDNLNQLTRENNAVANKTYVYTYDDAGNILTKKTYAYTTGTLGTVQSTNTYTYGNANWGDQLTKFNGTSITYDSLGNPLSYYNGNSYTFTWANGRQLASTVKGGVTTTYTYNADGIRIGKTVGSTAVEYILDGTQIVGEKNGSFIIRYLYDPQGAPVGMVFDSTTYLFEKNLQGDVIGIYTTGGTKVASYTYDAWGKIVSSSYTSGYYDPYYYNPFRYRGYYYDTESGFYYLQSRYYDPTTGRFLNADGYVNANGDLQGFNMYAYCSNNSVNYKQRPVSTNGSVVSYPNSSVSNGEIHSSDSISSGSVGSSRVNWENGEIQIPIWISSLMSGSDFGASITPALRTIYQYICYPGVKDLNRLYGLDFVPGKLNTVCSVIGYSLLGLNIGLSAWSNFTNDNLTTKQQWIGFGVDTAYILGTFGIGYGVGALVSLIPGVGVFIAPFVSAGVTWFIDWTNEKWRWLDDVKQWSNDL